AALFRPLRPPAHGPSSGSARPAGQRAGPGPDLQEDQETRRPGDQETKRHTLLVSWSPGLLVSSLRRCLAPRGLATAAGLLLAVGVSWWFVGEREVAGRQPAIAWLVNAQNCQWAEEEPAGDMRAGKVLKLERGLAEIRFQCGARVVLESPA